MAREQAGQVHGIPAEHSTGIRSARKCQQECLTCKLWPSIKSTTMRTASLVLPLVAVAALIAPVRAQQPRPSATPQEIETYESFRA